MPDPTTQERLRGLVLSAVELRLLTDWPEAVVEDYLNLLDNFILLSDTIDEQTDKNVEEQLYAMPTGKSYDSAIKDIRDFIVGSPVKKSYDAKIKNLEYLVASGALEPTREGDMEIFTSLGREKITKDLTFSNDTGTISLFTVTGDVWVNILPVITTDVTSAAGAVVRLGIVGNTDAMIVDSVATDLDARGIWVDQTPDNEIESTERFRGYFITDGNNIVLTTDLQVDAGAITFYCYWSPLSEDGNVVVA